MVHVLISMRTAALRNARRTRFGLVSAIASGVIGLLAAGSTLLFGFTAGGTAFGISDQLGLLTLTWTAGRIGFAAFSGGDAAIALDLFRIIPTPRNRLALSLLVVGFADPSLPFLAIALASVAVFGFRFGALAGLVGIVSIAALLVVVSFLSTLVAAVVPSGSRRRQDLGTLLAAVVISAVVVVGTLVGPVLAALSRGRSPVLSLIVRLLPSGWPGDAVTGVAAGNVLLTLLPLAALAAAIVLLAAWWPRVLATRLLSQASSGRRTRSRTGRRWLPASPIGSVVSRELRLWIRDPNRAGFLLIALIVGLGVCAVPIFSQRTTLLLPFAGIGTAIIAASIAGNSYGFDGRSIAIVLEISNAERVDVRGRQLAWLLLVGPYCIILSVAGLLIAGQSSAAPWVLALLPAVLGGGAGVIPLISLLAPQPLDDNGSPGPTWVAKAYATIILVCLTTVPALAFLIVGAATADAAMSWLGLPVGIVTGVLCSVVLGRVAGSRLVRRGPELFQVMATAGERN